MKHSMPETLLEAIRLVVPRNEAKHNHEIFKNWLSYAMSRRMVPQHQTSSGRDQYMAKAV